MKVIVVGGGWAGLAAAAELARNGARVTIVEAAPQLGGRARSIRIGDEVLDNGQHILIGAYRATRQLLRHVGLDESRLFRRLPLGLRMLRKDGRVIELNVPRALPAPLLWAFLRMRGVRWRDRFSALSFGARLRRFATESMPDRPALALLRDAGQSEAMIAALWEPLCVAALNTPLAEASARLWLKVLRDALLEGADASDLLLPIVDLDACLPSAARRFVEARAGNVRTRCRAHSLHIDKDQARGVYVDGTCLDADAVVVATGPAASTSLLAHPSLAPLRDAIDSLRPSPITTLYLRYPPHVTLGREFVGLLESSVQWLFDRGRLTGQPGLMAAVTSGPGAHAAQTPQAVIETMLADLHAHFPRWPAPTVVKLIREKSATFLAHPGVDAFRPGARTAVSGVWLAGDYTATGYPGTLEGAVRSGVECATLILGSRHAMPQRLSAA